MFTLQMRCFFSLHVTATKCLIMIHWDHIVNVSTHFLVHDYIDVYTVLELQLTIFLID